jgi:general secretion pathway protein D
MSRETTSSIGVTGELAASGSGGSTPGGSGGASGGSSTLVRTSSRNDFWEQLRDNLRAILNSTRLQSLTADAKAERLALVKQEQELRTKQIEAASRAGQGAPNLATSVITGGPGGGQQQTSLLPDDVIVNPVSGSVTINATEKQHQLVQQHIDSIVNAMQRQVLIEATIVEVQLADNYQGGVDWSRIASQVGFTFTQSLLTGFGAGLRQAGANFFQLGYSNPTSEVGNINVTVKLLQEFGNARVLSSPKLMTLNNQTALLKVVDNVVYFELRADTNTTQGVSTQTFNSTPKTVAVGVVMGVTPQINEDGRVSLTVRPTITRLQPSQPFVNDPNPSLCNVARDKCIINPVPQIQVREMESVLQIGSGQTVIMGGLMQDDVRRTREQVPGADQIGAAGPVGSAAAELLRFRDERLTKTELVIFLRPTVITNPSLDSDELKFFQRFLPKPEANPQQPERTGAAR